ncbi:MAG: VTT domain-containing protein [Proteobacteria bacterium]|nr:VTT domain-containing protein [Pseudomonadota bacterium]
MILVFGFLTILAVGAEIFGLREHFSLPLLQQKLTQNKVSGLSLFVMLFALGNLIQIPGWIFLVSAVLVFGRTTGGLVTYAAAISSCAFTYLTIRYIGGDAMRQLKSKLAVKLLTQLHNRPILIIATLRTFFQTLPALNYTLALSGVSFRQYMVGTLIGLPLPIAAYCLFFDYLVVLVQHS